MIALNVAGIGLILVGLAAVGYGIPVKEFSFGNTLILSGAIVASTGAILVALAAAVRELKAALERRPSADSAPAPALASLKRPPAPALSADDEPPARAPGGEDFLFTRDRPAQRSPSEPAAVGSESATAPWQQDAARERARQRAAAMAIELPDEPAPEPVDAAPEPEPEEPSVSTPVESEPPPRQRRNLLFTSSRRERAARFAERAAVEAGDAPEAGTLPVTEPRRSAFDEAWPEADRLRAETSRRGRQEPPPAELATEAEPAAGDQPAESAVTVLKRGVVDGMAYSLYSDGSIEAQMPEGMMRFASIDELRAYLDQRS